MSHYTAAPVIFSDYWNDMLGLLWKASVRGSDCSGKSFLLNGTKMSLFLHGFVVDEYFFADLPDPPSSGIFFVLFIFAIHTLSGRRTHGKSILIAATWVMFIVGTTRLVLHLAQTAMSVYAVQESIQNPAGLKPVRRLLFVLELTQNALFKLNVLVETRFIPRY
jgi:hypothetical protein